MSAPENNSERSEREEDIERKGRFIARIKVTPVHPNLESETVTASRQNAIGQDVAPGTVSRLQRQQAIGKTHYVPKVSLLIRVHETPFHTLDRDDERGLFLYVRNRTKYPTPQDFADDIESTWRHAQGYRAYGLVIDTRAVVGRNDDAFEAMTVKVNQRIMEEVARAAVLMQSQVGLLQSRRIMGGEGRGNILVTLDEEEAFQFASTHGPKS